MKNRDCNENNFIEMSVKLLILSNMVIQLCSHYLKNLQQKNKKIIEKAGNKRNVLLFYVFVDNTFRGKGSSCMSQLLLILSNRKIPLRIEVANYASLDIYSRNKI